MPSTPIRSSSSGIVLPCFFYALLAYTLVLIVPCSFQGTLPFLDSSWGYDLNYYLHSRFHFGHDLVFSYGPLGFLTNPAHVGNDIQIAACVHAVFLIALGYQLTSLWKSGRRTLAVMFCVSLALGHRMYYDYWDYSLLALGLITFVKLFRSPATSFDLCVLPVLLGTSFLLKFTAFSAMLLMAIAFSVHLISQHAAPGFRIRTIWLAFCFASGPLAFLIYDASPSHLLEYLKGSFQLAAGFTTAMSLGSDPRDWKLCAVVVTLLAVTTLLLLWLRRLLWSEALLILLITWTLFRHGFVRGGGGHTALFFGFSLVIFAILFTCWNEQVLRFPILRAIPEITLIISFMLFSFAALSGFAAQYVVLTASNWWPQQAYNDIRLLAQPEQLANALDHGADSLFAALPGMAFRDLLEGKRVMVFPNATPYVSKINFEMFPIYTLQDYAATTAYLDTTGAKRLAEANPPVNNVLLEWGDVVGDGRNQMLDSPAMTLALLSHFVAQQRAPEALLLSRRAIALPISFGVIGHEPFLPGQWVQIPPRNQLLAMTIHLRQRLAGKLVTNLYCQDAVYMDLETQSNNVLHFRVSPQLLSTPGIINYVPASLDQFEKLWRPQPLTDRIVRVRLTGPGLRWTVSNGYFFYQVDNAGITLAN
jgi:hypothetical protein